MRQHHANALLSDYAFDEAYKPAKLVLPSLGVLLLLLCLLTIFFLLLQGVQAIRHRGSRAAAYSDSVTEYAMNELGYEPRNLREK